MLLNTIKKGIVNPLAMILSLAMMFEYTLDKPELSKIIKKAVDEGNGPKRSILLLHG